MNRGNKGYKGIGPVGSIQPAVGKNETQNAEHRTIGSK
jgi:hypothetical protein